jgi:DNA-binding transcriptional LysR family regulator
MHMAHEYLSTVPFDLSDLHMFHLLAETASFTKAAHRSGLTQSSLTRRVQAMEEKLGTSLFERTTRQVRLTDAGRFLQHESARLIGDVATILKRVREDYTEARREVRVGVSRSISLAHLPGLFAANNRLQPDVFTRVTHDDSQVIIESLEQRKLDLGVICPPKRLPPGLATTHRFTDTFALIAARALSLPQARPATRAYRQWLLSQRWLTLHPRAQTARQINTWLSAQELAIEPAMELDSFDVIIHLVALGMGVALVPQRALAAFPRRRSIQRLPWKDRFSRELVVLARRDRKPAVHLTQFVENILF